MTAQNLIDVFQRTYRDCDDTRALAILNEIDEEILLELPLRRALVEVSLVLGTQEYTLDETVLRVWSARFCLGPSQTPLTETSIDSLDIDTPQWRSYGNGSALKFYTSANATTGTLGLVPPPNYSTLIVSGATNASPIVLTTGTHGLSDGDPVIVSGVGTNTAANTVGVTPWYAKVTGYSATTFALYSDSALTVPVVGNGVYSSGGTVSSALHPKVLLDVTQRTTLATNTAMPLSPQIRRLYVEGMRFIYARDRYPADAPNHRQNFEDALREQQEATMRRAGRIQFSIQLINQKRNFRGRNGRSSRF